MVHVSPISFHYLQHLPSFQNKNMNIINIEPNLMTGVFLFLANNKNHNCKNKQN